MQTADTKLPDGLVNTGKRPSGSFYHFISKFLYERVPTTKPSRTACGNSVKNDHICKKGSNGKGSWGFDVGEYNYYYDGHSYHKPQGSK